MNSYTMIFALLIAGAVANINILPKHDVNIIINDDNVKIIEKDNSKDIKDIPERVINILPRHNSNTEQHEANETAQPDVHNTVHHDNTLTYENNCSELLNEKKAAVHWENDADEKRDCMFYYYMKLVQWLKIDGTYNVESLNKVKNITAKVAALQLINHCYENVEDIDVRTGCRVAGCLRVNRIACAYS